MTWQEGGKPTLSPEEQDKVNKLINGAVSGAINLFRGISKNNKQGEKQVPTSEEVVIMDKMKNGSGCKEKGCGCGKPSCRNCCVYPFVGVSAAAIGALSLPAAIDTIKMISVILSH